jgi:hypothetical protein
VTVGEALKAKENLTPTGFPSPGSGAGALATGQVREDRGAGNADFLLQAELVCPHYFPQPNRSERDNSAQGCLFAA